MRPLGDPGAPLGLWAPRKILGCHPLSTALSLYVLYENITDKNVSYYVFFQISSLTSSFDIRQVWTTNRRAFSSIFKLNWIYNRGID